jgi:hypothetical protein
MSEIILIIFYVTSIIGFGFLAFYSITVYRDFKFKTTPRVNVYFENPIIFNQPNIYDIEIVVKNEGDVAVEKVILDFDNKEIFFDKDYSDLVFKNNLFNEGINLSPKTEFRIMNVIHTSSMTVHSLGKTYKGYEYYKDKKDKITAKLTYSIGAKEIKRNIELTLYHLFYQTTGKTLYDKIGLIEEHLKK